MRKSFIGLNKCLVSPERLIILNSFWKLKIPSLEDFKKLNPPVDLVVGAEIEMTIRGDTILYKNAVGGVGTIRSAAFTKAMCDVYYGANPVSPTHKEAVMKGIPEL